MSDPILPSSQPTESLVEQTQNRITELERLQRLQEQEKALLAQLGLNSPEQPAKRRRNSESSDESHGHGRAIKVKNLIRFTDSMTYRRRKEWLQDLQRAYAGDPKRYKTDSNRILFALDQMDEQPRNRWYSHCGNLPDDQRDVAETTWKHFEDWTQTCIRDWADLTSSAAKKLNDAKQFENQSPVDFHHYLEALEDQFPLQDDKSRALTFYTKLSDPIIQHIDKYIAQKPETREEMVRLATQVWQSFQPRYRNRRSQDHSSNTPHLGDYRPRGPQQPRHQYFNGRGNFHSRGKDTDHRRHPESNQNHHRDPPDSTHQNNDNVFRCWTCNSDQHLANNCPEKAKSLNQYRGYNNRGDYQRRGYRHSRGNRRGNGRYPR